MPLALKREKVSCLLRGHCWSQRFEIGCQSLAFFLFREGSQVTSQLFALIYLLTTASIACSFHFTFKQETTFQSSNQAHEHTHPRYPYIHLWRLASQARISRVLQALLPGSTNRSHHIVPLSSLWPTDPLLATLPPNMVIRYLLPDSCDSFSGIN